MQKKTYLCPVNRLISLNIMKKYIYLFLSIALLCACANDYKSDPTSPTGEGGFGADEGFGGGASGNGEGQGQPGMITAGEWRDLDNWLFWSNLMTKEQPDQSGENYYSYCDDWALFTNNRVAVRVKNAEGIPQRDVPIQLKRDASILYEARTDNKGETNLWIGLSQKQESVDATSLNLVVNGQALNQPVNITHWGEEIVWNECTASVTSTKNIDIAFIVDATGSMMDEIAFLKQDLTDIIDRVANSAANANIRTAALFYRDEGDDYLTRHSDFSADLSVTTTFIEQQNADGGGDYPEAVHTALEVGLQKLSWREDQCIRLAFMLLDAPPHHNESVIANLHQSIPLYAKAGIRIIPVAASGVDRSTEFFLRATAIATDATYVFITDDSGIGDEHLEPTVGDYQVELLNDLIVRLITQYME